MENNILLESIGKKIRTLRADTGLSQEKFALKINMDRTYFASIEAGKRNISILNLEKIASGFGITLSQLFEDVQQGGE